MLESSKVIKTTTPQTFLIKENNAYDHIKASFYNLIKNHIFLVYNNTPHLLFIKLCSLVEIYRVMITTKV
jgi:hypothetical protein